MEIETQFQPKLIGTIRLQIFKNLTTPWVFVYLFFYTYSVFELRETIQSLDVVNRGFFFLIIIIFWISLLVILISMFSAFDWVMGYQDKKTGKMVLDDEKLEQRMTSVTYQMPWKELLYFFLVKGQLYMRFEKVVFHITKDETSSDFFNSLLNKAKSHGKCRGFTSQFAKYCLVMILVFVLVINYL